MSKSPRNDPRKPEGTPPPSGGPSDAEPARVRPGPPMTTDQGVKVAHTDDSLKAGPRGPTILEDFHLREKITRFDHERIPERVVHARGTGAHGHFQVYESLSRWTRAAFLNDPGLKTPVFARFSTVAGSRGSADTARDVRGFAVKFYTAEGNFDLVGNNMPVFFIQDGIKFPDLIHAVKPEPRNEIPQASSAHDTFWDFISLTPETTHMILWVMSDRAIPRSLRMMEGFGVHTFRLVDAEGGSRLCKFHWKPVLGTHALVWNEAQLLAGFDPDFHRRDLFDAIEAGEPAEFELGLQVIEEADELAYGFDLLDATKLVPEELVPVEIVGKLTLDRNPDNFFAETEQVAFHVGNVVPGVDLTNDPLLQVRLFSYMDTQLTRLGGPNFAQIPINRPLVPVRNHQQDGLHQHAIPTAGALYHPNSVGFGQPELTPPEKGGYAHHAERVEGSKVRARSESFADHFGQARLFLRSQSSTERMHLLRAFRFELGKVVRPEIRERMVGLLTQVDPDFAREVASALGVRVPDARAALSASTADGGVATAPTLSMLSKPTASVRTRRIALLAADGVNGNDVATVTAELARRGAVVEVVGPRHGTLKDHAGGPLEVDKTLLTTPSVVYDAVFVPGGASAPALAADPAVRRFLDEAYRHCKAIGSCGDGTALVADMLRARGIDPASHGPAVAGVVSGKTAASIARPFVGAVAAHRHFEREHAPEFS